MVHFFLDLSAHPDSGQYLPYEPDSLWINLVGVNNNHANGDEKPYACKIKTKGAAYV